MNAIVVTGLGFGDEGKGTLTDYLTHRYNAEWVYKYCGGAQAAHTVQLNGHRHVFSQFGAGTFSGAKTFLGPDFLFDLHGLHNEQKALENYMGVDLTERLVISPKATFISNFAICLNRYREILRGENRHGSCFYGIGETRKMKEEHDLYITSEDILDERHLTTKLTEVRKYVLDEMEKLKKEYEDLPEKCTKMRDVVFKTDSAYYAEIIHADFHYRLADEPEFGQCTIYEGSQGLLLDHEVGYRPHTTWGDVTPKNAIKGIPSGSYVAFLGVLRSFSTRHGNGPFPSDWGNSEKPIEDLTNKENEGQGSLRCGYFDFPLYNYVREKFPIIDNIALTWMEKPQYPVVTRYVKTNGFNETGIPNFGSNSKCLQHMKHDDFIRKVGDVKIISVGPERSDKISVGELTFHLKS